MKPSRVFLHRLCKGDRGQALAIVTIGLTAFIGLAGVSVETAHAYYAYERLQASTNAAALAGAQAMPDTTQAAANVNAYSSATVNGVTGLNATPLLTNVQVTSSFVCSTTVTNMNVACETSNGGSGGYNAIKVTQTAQVPSWFAGLFGFKTFNLSYTAMAAMRGGMDSPWNIAIVLDTTRSMSSPDSGAQCSGTQISCAIKGVQSLLEDLEPCTLGQSCTANGVAVVDNVALYVFPPVSTATASYDYCSGGSGNPTHGYYWVPTLNSGYPSANTGYTYQIIPYSNNYRTSDAATTLNTSANIVKATGYSGTGCSGIQAPGGAGTYYAQVIYQAQSDLVAQQALHKGSQNAMIILSDGDATACNTSTYGQKSGSCSTNQIAASAANSLNGLTTNKSTETSYAYPSALGECGQAVQAAIAAASAGTTVITIGYGSEMSGCSSDAQYSYTTPSTWWASWGPGGSPCAALKAMASAAVNFYSDDANGCQATVPTNQQFTKLTQIFQQITNNMTVPRLIPANSN